LPTSTPSASRASASDIARLLADAGIVRHRGKIESTINNAKRVIELRAEFGSLAAYAWRFEPAPEVAAEAHDAFGAEGDDDLARIDRDVEGPEEARLELRRPDHGLCVHAGDGAGQRPPRRLRIAPLSEPPPSAC
jgi:hypothetical protein